MLHPYLGRLFGLGGCSAVALAVLGVFLLTPPHYLLLLLKHKQHTAVKGRSRGPEHTLKGGLSPLQGVLVTCCAFVARVMKWDLP